MHIKKIVYIAIFSALPEELRFFHDLFSKEDANPKKVSCDNFTFIIYKYRNKNILLSTTGFGTTFAATVLALICERFNPSYVF
jgi:nucleoside phosphorylase